MPRIQPVSCIPSRQIWSLRGLPEKLSKISAKVIRQSHYVAFQMAHVAHPKHMLTDILPLIAEVRPTHDPTPAGTGRLSCVPEKTKGNQCLGQSQIDIAGQQ